MSDIKFLVGSYYFYGALCMSTYWLLDTWVSDKKLAGILTKDCMYVVNHFSPAAFKILFLAFDSLLIISLNIHLFEFISSLKIHDFLHIWKVLSHYCFKYFLLLFLFLFSFRDSNNAFVGPLNGVPQVPWALFILLHFFIVPQTW